MKWIGLLVVFAACSSVVTPDDVALQFEIVREGRCSADMVTIEAAARPVAGGVEVEGVFGTANSGYTLTATYDPPEDGGLDLVVTGEWLGGLAIAACHHYRGRVTGLPRRSYDLTVRHVNLAENVDQPYLVTTVDVRW